MTKLNQLIAVAQGKKANAKKVLEKSYHLFQKPQLFNGLERTYQPKDDEGETLPSESQRVQFNVDNILRDITKPVSDMMNVVASQDMANTAANADVVVGEQTILNDVPATTLIFLEKQLTDLYTFINNVPILDSSEDWNFDTNLSMHVSKPVQTTRTQKVQEPIVLYDATPEHPAQTQLVTKDVVAGFWTNKKISGAWTLTHKNQVLERIQLLKEAVVKAREKANSQEIVDVEIGNSVFNFLLKD